MVISKPDDKEKELRNKQADVKGMKKGKIEQRDEGNTKRRLRIKAVFHHENE